MVSETSAAKIAYKNLMRYATQDEVVKAEKCQVLAVMDLIPASTKAAVFVRSTILRSLNRSSRGQGTRYNVGQRAGAGRRTSEARAVRLRHQIGR
jgi:hypothetical protein